MSTNVKFTLWIVSIALFAFVAGRFVTPGKVGGNNKPTTSVTQTGRGTRGGVAGTSTSPTPANKGARGGRFAPQTPPETLSIAELYRLLEQSPSPVKRLTFVNGKNEVVVEREGKSEITVKTPDDGGKQELRNKAAAANVEIAVKEITVDPVVAVVEYLGPTLLIVGILLFIFFAQRRAQSGELKNMSSSRAKDAATVTVKKTTFRDVAGCDEAVKELQRVVKGLVDADAYTLFGAERPRGVLLIGPPGTGKTLLAKAVAGETDGTFDITSGSDFVEMLVGVGASRVRDLFGRGRKRVAETKKPHIIFIDEIDAVGGKRGGGTASGSNSEREQTLNQILVEMDGMVSNDGIIVIAATNRVDMLDEALLRQGRFECHVSVDLPDKAGREAIFAIHIGDRKLAPEVTLSGLASRTFGYSGAEIKGVCNRAFLLAAERYAKKRNDLRHAGVSAEEIKKQVPTTVLIEDFDEGIDFVRYGSANPGRQARMSLEDKRNTAYHEAGHAVGGDALKPFSDEIGKITIMNRSKALGYVQFMPNVDRVSYRDKQALARIVIAMCGRAAQEVYLQTVDTGASNDFQQASDLARKMVISWGMSKLGNISVNERLEGVGPDLANEIDREWRRITNECYQLALRIVEAEKPRVEALVSILMEKETVLPDEWKALLKRVPSSFNSENPLQLPKTA